MSSIEENTILYIDDEKANLDGFKFNFHKRYKVFLALNTEAALDIINTNNIKVIISDNRMPEVTGTEFFEALSVSHPDIIRILVTAYADTEAVMEAINKAKVYRYITKPWNKEDLRVTIDNALEAYDLKKQNLDLLNFLTTSNKELEELNSRLLTEVDERKKAELELAKHRDNLELIVKQRTEEIETINKKLANANSELLLVNRELNETNRELEVTNKKLYHENHVRTQIQEQLIESENKFRNLIQQSSEGIMLINIEGIIVECNKAVGQIFDIDYNKVSNTYSWDFDFLFTPQKERNQETLQKIKRSILDSINNLEPNQSVTTESYCETYSGSTKFINSINFPIVTPKGKFLGRIFRDYTEKKKIENSLRKYKDELEEQVKERTAAVHQYSDIVQNMEVALIVFHIRDLEDPETIYFVKVNPAAEKIIGKKAEDLIGKNINDAFPVLKDYNVTPLLSDVIKTGKSNSNEEFRYYEKNGDILFFSAKAFRLPDNHVSLLFEDVTKRKRIEQAVKENEERYRALFEKSPDGIYVLGTNGEYTGKIVSANSKMVDMLGYSMDELIGMTSEILIRDVKKEARKTFTQRMMAGETITFDTFIYRKDNSFFPVEVTNSIISIADQILILCINRDISERKRSEQLLIESEQKLLNIFNSSSDAIIISDMNCNMIEVNQTFLDIIGLENSASVYGKNIDTVLPGLNELIKKIPSDAHVDDKLSNLEIELTNKKGAKIVVDINSKIINHAGKTAILIIVRDITEKKDIEKKLFEKIIFTEEKERERFAGNLHDEVGPLLSSLKMYISLLAETDDKKKKEYIIPQIQTLIKESITTVREISNDLSPHVLNNYGCVAAINSFLGMKNDFLNISFRHTLENIRFNQSTEIVIYRIIKELVNNTIKHAKASRIEIEMYEENSMIKCTYKDDGEGFDINNTINSRSGSIGLLNIMSRVKTVNGKYKISSKKGKGFIFELVVPLTKSN